MKGLNLNVNALNAIGTSELPASAQPDAVATKPDPFNIPYKAERDAFMRVTTSETGRLGILASDERDARRIRTKHYRARGQLQANGVTMFNNIVVTAERYQGNWYCILTYHKAYEMVDLPPVGADVEASLGLGGEES